MCQFLSRGGEQVGSSDVVRKKEILVDVLQEVQQEYLTKYSY